MKKNIFGWFYQPFCIYSSSQLESQQKGEFFSRVLTLKLILRLLWASLGRSHWQSDSPIGSRYLKGRFARASVGTCRFPAGSENPPNRSSLSRSRAGSTDRSSWSIETRGICINQEVFFGTELKKKKKKKMKRAMLTKIKKTVAATVPLPALFPPPPHENLKKFQNVFLWFRRPKLNVFRSEICSLWKPDLTWPDPTRPDLKKLTMSIKKIQRKNPKCTIMNISRKERGKGIVYNEFCLVYKVLEELMRDWTRMRMMWL